MAGYRPLRTYFFSLLLFRSQAPNSSTDAPHDLWIFSAYLVRTSPEWAHLDLFDRDKETLKPKGVLEVVL